MTFSPVQAVTASGNSGTSASVSCAATAAKNFLFFAIMTGSGSVNPTFTMPAGWLQVQTTQQENDFVHDTAACWYYPDNPGGITSVACTMSVAPSGWTVVLVEFPGVGMSSGALDASAVFAPAGNANTSASVSATSTVNGDLLLGVLALDPAVSAGSHPITEPTGWTSATSGTDAGGWTKLDVAYNTQAVAGAATYNPTWTGNADYIAFIATFKPNTHSTHTSSGALAQVHNAAVKHTASGAVAQIHATPVHHTLTASGAVVEVAKLPPLMPVISRSQPAYASDITYAPSLANDADYATTWATVDVPSVSAPVYWAVDLSAVPAAQRQQVVLVWYGESADGYWVHNGTSNQYTNEPRDYTIDINTAAGGSYPTSGWQTVATVSGNEYWTREHKFTLGGANWVRINITASNGQAPNNTVRFQVDVHSTVNGDFDDWLMLGDSITAEAWQRHNIDGSGWRGGPIPQWVNASLSYEFPLMMNGGYGGQTMAWGAQNIASLLAPFTGHYVSIAYGTNDCLNAFEMSTAQFAAVYANLLTIIDAVLALGAVPVVPYVPYGNANTGYLGTNALLLNEYVDAHLHIDRPGQFLRGPDLWAPFYRNQQLLRDGIHPTYTEPSDGTYSGYDLYHQVWRDWLLSNAVYATPRGSQTASGAVAQVSVTGGKQHVYHQTLSAVGQVKAHLTHTAFGAIAQLVRNIIISGVTAQVHNPAVKHSSSGAAAQVIAHLRPAASGALVQVHNAAVRHTSTSAVAQVYVKPPSLVSVRAMVRDGRATVRTR